MKHGTLFSIICCACFVAAAGLITQNQAMNTVANPDGKKLDSPLGKVKYTEADLLRDNAGLLKDYENAVRTVKELKKMHTLDYKPINVQEKTPITLAQEKVNRLHDIILKTFKDHIGVDRTESILKEIRDSIK